MYYNSLMFSNAEDIGHYLLYVLRTMLSVGFVPCTISPTTTWNEWLTGQF